MKATGTIIGKPWRAARAALAGVLGRAPAAGTVSAIDSGEAAPVSVAAPWIIDAQATLTLRVPERRLRGRPGLIARLDLYPFYAPSHRSRHFGFWDIPLSLIRGEETPLRLTEGAVLLENPGRTVRVEPVWRSSLPLRGTAMLHVSLWDLGARPPTQRSVVSSLHLLLHGGRDLPLEFAYLSLTQRCNLACPMCMRHTPARWEAADASQRVLDRFIAASDGLQSVFIGGIGEPLLDARLESIVAALKARMPSGGHVGFNTNGMLLDGGRADRLLAAGTDWICFSVDGARPATYERIRPGGRLEQVTANIAAAVAARRRAGRSGCHLSTNFVVQEENAAEIPAFVELAAGLGLDAVNFSHRRDYRVGEFRVLDRDRLEPLFARAVEAGSRLGIRVALQPIEPAPAFRCRFVQTVYLHLDGTVVPCCRMLPGASPRPVLAFGRLGDEDLGAIWRRPDFTAFRRRILAADPPETCRGCNYAYRPTS